MSLLVLNFIPDPAKALDEMIRVTRPNGTVAAAVWDYGKDMEMLRVFWDEAIPLNPATAARDERHMPRCRKGELEDDVLNGRLSYHEMTAILDKIVAGATDAWSQARKTSF